MLAGNGLLPDSKNWKRFKDLQTTMPISTPRSKSWWIHLSASWLFRVYSGTMNSGSYVLNSTKGKRERIGRILQMHANHREELTTVYSGDIAAAVGLKFTTTGDTLCDENHPIILESMEFPEPVINVAIDPKTKVGQEKMSIALQKLAEEDPTFRVSTNQETGQTIIAGMGELHLEIIVDRLLRELKVEAMSESRRYPTRNHSQGCRG